MTIPVSRAYWLDLFESPELWRWKPRAHIPASAIIWTADSGGSTHVARAQCFAHVVGLIESIAAPGDWWVLRSALLARPLNALQNRRSERRDRRIPGDEVAELELLGEVSHPVGDRPRYCGGFRFGLNRLANVIAIMDREYVPAIRTLANCRDALQGIVNHGWHIDDLRHSAPSLVADITPLPAVMLVAIGGFDDPVVDVILIGEPERVSAIEQSLPAEPKTVIESSGRARPRGPRE